MAVFGGGAVTESTNGGFLEFRNVDGASGGMRTLRFRVALGVANTRTGRLVVNGAASPCWIRTPSLRELDIAVLWEPVMKARQRAA